MKRRIMIVPEGEVGRYIEEANRLGILEVVEGVPPRLVGKVDRLPAVYEEEVEEVRDAEEERRRLYRERLERARGVEEKVEILLEYLGLVGS